MTLYEIPHLSSLIMFKTLEEIRSNYSYPDMDKKTDEELEEYLLDGEWIKIGDRYVRHWGI